MRVLLQRPARFRILLLPEGIGGYAKLSIRKKRQSEMHASRRFRRDAQLIQENIASLVAVAVRHAAAVTLCPMQFDQYVCRGRRMARVLVLIVDVAKMPRPSARSACIPAGHHVDRLRYSVTTVVMAAIVAMVVRSVTVRSLEATWFERLASPRTSCESPRTSRESRWVATAGALLSVRAACGCEALPSSWLDWWSRRFLPHHFRRC